MPRTDEEFDAFFRKDYPALVRHLVILGFEVQLAKDAAQEAMTLAYRDWSEVREPKAWVRVVGRRAAGRLHSRHIDEQRLHAENPQSGRAAPWEALDPHRRWEAKVEQQAVLDALLRLPPKQQEVMAWTFDGFAPVEIATQLNMPVTTVRSNLRHARNVLKDAWSTPENEGR